METSTLLFQNHFLPLALENSKYAPFPRLGIFISLLSKKNRPSIYLEFPKLRSTAIFIKAVSLSVNFFPNFTTLRFRWDAKWESLQDKCRFRDWENGKISLEKYEKIGEITHKNRKSERHACGKQAENFFIYTILCSNYRGREYFLTLKRPSAGFFHPRLPPFIFHRPKFKIAAGRKGYRQKFLFPTANRKISTPPRVFAMRIKSSLAK